MQRAYLMIAGILTGAAVGLLTGRIVIWICVGLAMGMVLALAARRRVKTDEKVIAESRRLTADGRF